MSPKRVLNSDSGFGMVELAVAIIVLGIVLVGLFPVMVNSIRLADNNAVLAQANSVVASNLDRVQASGVSGTCTSGSYSGPDSLGGLMIPPPTVLRGDIFYSCLDGETGLVTVRVDVWMSADSTQKPLSSASTKVFAS